jgi:hypothetical protein
MSGTMSDIARDAAMRRLERAAKDYTAGRLSLIRLGDAWRSMPETERDDIVPAAAEILAICRRYWEQKVRDERIAAREREIRIERAKARRR